MLFLKLELFLLICISKKFEILSYFFNKLFFKMPIVRIHLLMLYNPPIKFWLFIWPFSYKLSNSVFDISYASHYFPYEILLENMFSNNLSYKCTDSCRIFGSFSRHSLSNSCKLFQDFIFKIKDGDFAFLVIDIEIIFKKII